MLAANVIGFSGTREGMTPEQVKAFRFVLGYIFPVVELHHGDCIGADAQAHEVFDLDRKIIVVHPPENSALRAFCNAKKAAQKTLDVAMYNVRNRAIVDSSYGLIVCPSARSRGTVTTKEYAIGKKPVWVIRPDGAVEFIPLRKDATERSIEDLMMPRRYDPGSYCGVCGQRNDVHPLSLDSIIKQNGKALAWIRRSCEGGTMIS